LENSISNNRICFTFSKGFGNAVQRNRARRLGREAYRLLKPELFSGYDLILLVHPETDAMLSFRTKQLKSLFTKAGLLASDNLRLSEASGCNCLSGKK
jgi:ribonuclease P protein component